MIFISSFLNSSSNNSICGLSNQDNSFRKSEKTVAFRNKRLLLLPLLVLGFLFSNGNVWGQQSAGFNNTFIVLSLNGGANTYYDLNANTPSADFNGANLGSFVSGSNNLVFKGAEHNVYKCYGADISSTRVYYRIYLTSAGASGNFTSNNITYTSGFNNGCGGQDQKWDKLDYSTNLLSGLAPGNYSIQVYSDASTTLGDRYASNGGLNYTASFTVSGNYYSKSTGNLELTSSWGTSIDGTGNAPANFTTAGNTFNIRNNATPTIGASWTVSEAGSKIIVGDGTNACNFTVPSTFIVTSPTTDVSNNGTITRTTSGANSWGTLTFASGAKYVHNASGGTLPTATWNANSTLQIDANLAADQFTQSFGNVTVNNTAAFFISTTSGTYTGSIQGNFTHNSSGAISLKNTLWDATFTIGGNLSITGGGTLRIMESIGLSSTRNQKLIVNGNFLLSNGTFNLSNESSSAVSTSSVFALLEVKGNFTHTAGTVSETATDADVVTRITLTGTTGTQTLESTGQTGTVNFVVAGSNAQCVVSATKTFTLSSGSSMTIGAGTSNPDFSISGSFLNQSSTSLTVTSATIGVQSGGNYICNHGTGASIATPLGITTFNSGSTMTYRGSSSLTTPISLSGRTYHHLVIESTSGALSLAGTGGSALIINGDLTIGANCTFGPNVTATPNHSIKGNITIGSGGTLNYNPLTAGTINLNGSGTQTISGAGTFTTGANATLAVGATSTIDFGATNAIAGSGTYTTASGSTLITANTSGINGSLTLTNRSLNAGTNYTFNNSAPSAQVTGAALTAANNITLNNSAGITLSANTSVTGTLTLTSGKLTTNGFTLNLSNAVSGGSSSNYIVADATGTATFNGVTTARVFPLGTASAYAPMTVTAGSSTNYTAYVTGTSTWPGSCTPTTTSQMVNLAWGLSGSNIPSQVVFQWPAGSQAGSFDPATSCDLGRYNTSCPYNVTNISAASGSGPYTLTCTTGLGSTSNIYVIGNQHAVYIAAPTVTSTVAASSITNTTASSGGETITGSSITSKGVVWNTSTAPTVALSTKTDEGTGSADFTSSVTSLSPETLYYFRAYVTNAAGTGYGDEKTFRTLSNPATAQASSLTATANSPSNIDLTWNAATFPSSGATNKGYVLLRATSPNSPSLGNSNGAAPSAGANTTIVSSAIAEGATSISNSGLASSTQYNYLLIPYTWNGMNAITYNYLTASAPTANATTQSGATPPVLTTSAVSSVLSSTATLNGEITSDGGASVSARGFVYSTSDNTPTIGEGGVTDQASGTGTGTFNSSVSSLSPNTTYYYQAYATNTSGTSYGGVISFTTLKAEPSAQPTSLVFSSVTTTSFNTAFTAATGSPDGYLVIRSTSSSLSADPVDGTNYTAGNSLGVGTVVSVGITISGISNSSLSAGNTYYTYVFAYNNSGSNIDYRTTSPLSASAITLTDAPATPTFSGVTTSGFTVDWTATTGASSYKLDVSTASNFGSYVSGYDDLTVNTNSQAVTGLAANTLYYVRVRAVNASGTSANSTSSNSPTLSNAPTVGTASSITTSGLTANWTAPSLQGAVTLTYTVELSTTSDFSSITSTASSIASGTITNAFSSLAEGTTYYYRIKAVNSAGSSAWSSVSAGATTLTSSISLTALGTNFTQDFNSLATSGTSSSLPSGWYLSETGGANIYTAGSGSSATADAYSFGSTASSDRSLGSLVSNSYSATYGAKFTNNTGEVINNLFISYLGETWRVAVASRTDQLDFQYSLNATSLTTGTWTDFNDLDYVNTSQSVTGGGSLQQSTSISSVLTGLSISNGSTFWIRWSDLNISGNDDGMGIDDFSIKPCGTVSAPTASDQAFCSAASPAVASLTATGTSIQWYSASSGGTALSSSTALTTATTYYATQTDGGCESVSRTAVVVTINNTPSVPTGTATQIFCSTSSPTVNELSATGTSIQWYEASSGGSALATNTSLVNSTIYYATQTVSGCESTTRLAVTASLVNNGTWLGSTSTDWNTASNWCGGVPTSSTNVVINSGASNYPNLSIGADGVANTISINSGGSFTMGGSELLTITAGGNIANSGTFTAGANTSLIFAGTASVTGTISFNNVTISGALTPSAATSINGTLTINSGGTVVSNSPIFGSSSTLQYNFGGGFVGRRSAGLEWPATNGPSHLTITNGSWIQLTGNRSLTGNATVTNGSLQASGGCSLTMNGSTQTLTISTSTGGAVYGTDNGFGNDLSLVIANGSTTTFTGDATSSGDEDKKLFNVTVNTGGTLILSRGILCKYGTFTVNGTLRIDANGYVQSTNGIAPTYGGSSNLIYNTGGSYGRGLEWSATSGAGYPNNVSVTGNTTLNLVNSVNSFKKAAGNLTVDAGSTFSVADLTVGSSGVGVEFLGNIINDGTISLNTGSNTTSQRLKAVSLTNGNSNSTATVNLSGAIEGDLELTGNYTDNANFTANNRAVFFTGTGLQTIGGAASAPFNIHYIVVTKASGSVQLLKDLLIAAPNMGNAITLSTSADILDLNGFNLTLGTSGQSSTVSGNGFVKASSTSSLTLLGTGALGTIRFDQTTPGTTNALGALTINRTNSGSVLLGNAIAVTNALTITEGNVNLGTAIHSAGSLSLGGTSQTTSSSYGGTGSPAATINTTYFAATTGVVNVGNCSAYSITSTSAVACVGSAATVTLSNSTTSQLPVGNYTVFYTLTGANTGSSSSAMTVTAAGSGSFATTTIANSGATTITINYIRNGCVSAISSGNTAAITINALPTALSLTGSSYCATTSAGGTVVSGTSAIGVNYSLYNNGVVMDGTEKNGTGSALTWSAVTAGSAYTAIGTNATTTCSSPASNAVAVTISDTNGAYTYYLDTDGDGFGNAAVSQLACVQPTGYLLNNTDCDDAVATTYPGATELCNSVDDNCSGFVDEGCPSTIAGEEPFNSLSAPSAMYSYCSSFYGTLAGAFPSTLAQSTCITGEDRWYNFTALSTGVTVFIGSNANDIVIELQDANGNVIDVENTVLGIGTEVLTTTGLTAGLLYRVGVRNYNSNAQAGGQFSGCIRHLRAGGSDSGTSATWPSTIGMCNVFKAAYCGGTGVQYRYTWTGLTGIAAGQVYTRTQTSDYLTITSVTPMLPAGCMYNVLVTTIYTIPNGAGTNEVFEMPAATPTTITISANPLTSLRTSDRCSAGPRYRGAVVASLPWVCGVTNWRWRFTEVNPLNLQTVGLPIEQNRGAASNYLTLTSVTALQYGKTYAVQTSPIYTYTSTNYQWGPVTYMCIIGSAGMVVDSTEDVSQDASQDSPKGLPEDLATHLSENLELSVYPNPSNGEGLTMTLSGVTSSNVQVKVYDALGRKIESKRYAVDGTLQTTLNFANELSNGLYILEVSTEDVTRSVRFMVEQ